MAALVGFDSYEDAEVVSTPISGGATLMGVSVPAGTAIAGLDFEVSDLDSNATPLVALDIGDVDDLDRFVADDTTARAGGTLEYRPVNTSWYRYSSAASVLVTVATAPATGASGAVSLVVYGYPAVDRAVLVRQTLQALGVVAEGETPRAEDAAVTLEALADIHEMMRGKGIANRQDLAWPLLYVPLFASRPYAAMAANLLADTFGLSAQRAARMAQRAAEAERELRRQTRKATDYSAVSLEPYEAATTTTTDYSTLA